MKRKFLATTLISVIFSIPVSLHAGNLSNADDIVLSRVAAYVFPDIARSACRNQSNEIKKRLETALRTSGLTSFQESDICGDGVCLRASGDEEIKRDPNAIKVLIDNFRSEQVKNHSRRSQEELNRLCQQSISSLENVKAKGKKSEEIMSELFDKLQR